MQADRKRQGIINVTEPFLSVYRIPLVNWKRNERIFRNTDRHGVTYQLSPATERPNPSEATQLLSNTAHTASNAWLYTAMPIPLTVALPVGSVVFSRIDRRQSSSTRSD